MNKNNNNRVVVTGVGIVTGNALTKEEFIHSMKNGLSAIKFQQFMKDFGMQCNVAGVPSIPQVKIDQYLTEEDLTAMNSVMIYAAIAGIDAWKDAGFYYDKNNRSNYDPDTSVILGCGMGGVETVVNKVSPRLLDKKISRLGSTTVEQSMNSNSNAKLTCLLGAGGKSVMVSSACLSGTEAIIDAYNYIKLGKTKRVVCGGVESAHEGSLASFDAMKVINRKMNDKPEQASRSLSATASGFVPSGGAGILVLESLDSALERGAEIYCEIIGASLNSGGFRNGGTMTAPSPVGVRNCIKNAILDANIHPKEIDVINGHLTSTMADPLEIKNWAYVFNEFGVNNLPIIQASKSILGHGLGASGGFESVICALQLKHQFVHKTINCEDLHPEIEPWRASVNYETKEMSVNIIAKSSFGFGDVNGCLLFKKY